MRGARGRFLLVLRRLQDYSFTPPWLPALLRSQRAGVLVAGVGGTLAGLVRLFFLVHDPTMAYPGAVLLAVGLGVTASWGLGPGLLAICVGVLAGSPLVLRSPLVGLHVGPDLS